MLNADGRLSVADRIYGFAIKHHGIITTRDLDSIPTTPSTLRSLADRRTLIRVSHGVYRTAETPLTGLTRLMAICRWAHVDEWMLTGRIARWLFLESDEPEGWEQGKFDVTLRTGPRYRPNQARKRPLRLRIQGEIRDEAMVLYKAFVVEKPVTLLAELALESAQGEFAPSDWRNGSQYAERFRTEHMAYSARKLLRRSEEVWLANLYEMARRYHCGRLCGHAVADSHGWLRLYDEVSRMRGLSLNAASLWPEGEQAY